jgi:hypothetical protein
MNDEFVATAIPLLHEYSEKLERLAKTLYDLWIMRGTFGGFTSDQELLKANLLQRWERLSGPVYDLIQEVSGRLSEGVLTPSDRIKLKLGLADCESQYETAKAVAARVDPGQAAKDAPRAPVAYPVPAN